MKQEQKILNRPEAKSVPEIVGKGNQIGTAVHQTWRAPVQTKEGQNVLREITAENEIVKIMDVNESNEKRFKPLAEYSGG